MRDFVSLNIYFKGHDDISNQKYYTIDNLSEDKFNQCRHAIFDVVEAMSDVFGTDYVDLSFETGENIVKDAENKSSKAEQLARLRS